MKTYLILFLLVIGTLKLSAQVTYFPPISSTATWDTIAPSELGWCQPKIDSLYDFLQSEGSKGFIVLKGGKIVLEKYFGTFTKDSNWYWASAGKTLTSFLIGQAQDEGLLSIQDVSSTYLGNGWTSCTTPQENQIKIVNQLSMNTGLDDGVAESDCTLDTCLLYKAPVATRWAYHNAPYTLLEKVIENASGSSINQFTTTRLKNKIGMNGIWYQPDFNNVFYSTARSMARFGLLIQHDGIWNNDTLLKSVTYKNAMHTPSQNLNKSYGYLWWLNGYASYMLPGFQTIIPGSICPDAPTDMYSGIGKNGQLVSISPSNNMVMVRMGENANNSPVSTILLNSIWQRISQLACEPASVKHVEKITMTISPNPAKDQLKLSLQSNESFQVNISNIIGNRVFQANNQHIIDVSYLPSGIYFLKITQNGQSLIQKFTKQ